MKKSKAIFAAGCFWSIQEEFDKVLGVISTKVGYTGGSINNPSYEQVCSEETGHAEAIEIIFDSEKISFEKLLNIFWKIHNPTTLNRQGPDIGSSYRSAIFYTNDYQKEIAEKTKKKIQKNFEKQIVTEIEKASEFYPAEEYHQKYNKKNKKTCRI